MVIDKIKNTIIQHELIKKGEHIVMGLSGGPDSVCLFYALYQLKEFFDIKITAVHINHGLRPGAADEDQRYVEKLCKTMGITCHSFFFDVDKIAKEERLSSEDAGRKVRYQSFYKVARDIKNQKGRDVKIVVAQNMNDQAETLLMRIMRGTGTHGLAGIEYKRRTDHGWEIIRPLLDVSREEIETFCRENHLNPRFDHTNQQAIYTRNKVRLELIPYIEKNFNPNLVAALNRLAMIAREDKEYLYEKVEEIIGAHAKVNTEEYGRASLSVEVLMAEHPAIRHRIIISLFEKIGLPNNISTQHLLQADKLLKGNKSSSYTDFASGYGMKISYGVAEFYKKKEGPIGIEAQVLPLEGIVKNNELNGQIWVRILEKKQWQDLRKSNYKTNANVCAVSWDELEKKGLDLVLRTRRPGDYIFPLGMKGRKKLQDYFVDAKIEKEKRDFVPLVCIGSEVIWIVGKRTSESYKITEDTGKILLLEYSNII